MKINVLGTRGIPNIQGGIETHCGRMYPYMSENGADITVLTRAPYVDPALREYRKLKLVSISCPRHKYLEALYHTFVGIFAAKKMGADILHIHAIGPSLFTPLARLLGMKVIMTHHGADYMRQKWNVFAKVFLKTCEYMGVRYANTVIAVSDSIAQHVTSRYGRKCMVIPNGVSIPQPADTAEGLKIYGLETGKYLLAVGRLVPEKGLSELVDAFGIAQSDIKGWKLAIVGGADHETDYSIRLKSKAAGNPDIVMTGQLNAKPLAEIFTHAGLFILPSYHEGMPIALLEAMSYGLSCVVSDIEPHRELAIKRERMFKPGDIKAMSERIREFARSGIERQEREAQIDMLKERYDWAKIADATFSLYKECLPPGKIAPGQKTRWAYQYR